MDKVINRIVAQEPDSVAQLFNLYGYDMPPTAKNLKNLVIKYGGQPLPFSDVTDTEQPKKSFADILGVITSGAQSLASVISAVRGTTPVAQSNSVKVGLDSSSTPQTQRVFGIDRNIFIVLAILTLLVIGLLLFRKK